jgi:hypothetical protein
MELAQSVQIMKALADTSRLMIVQSLQVAQYVEELAERCNLAPSTVCFHLGKLEKAGLVKKRKEQYYAVYSLNSDIFDKSLKDLTTFRNADQFVQEDRVRRYRAKVLKTFMKNGKVIRIPAQYKKRLIVFEEILTRFQPGTTYKENLVDEIIGDICADYCTVRRTFIDEGLMVRHGELYELTKPVPVTPAEPQKETKRIAEVKSIQDIKREYKERKKPAGVFQVKNLVNGKILLGSSLNLEGPLNSHKFMLGMGSHRNDELQKEFNQYGSENFVFEILETVKVTDDPNFNLADELTLIEQIWLEKLQPFGERGYNKDSKIRQV